MSLRIDFTIRSWLCVEMTCQPADFCCWQVGILVSCPWTLGSVLWASFSTLKLLVGWQAYDVYNNLCHLSSKILFQNKQMKKTNRKPVDLTSPGKWSLKNSRGFAVLLTTEAGNLMKVWMVSVDVHNAVGTSVVVAANTVLLNIFPWCLVNSNVVEFQPLIRQWAVDVCPVMAWRSLALVNQHCMQLISTLHRHKEVKTVQAKHKSTNQKARKGAAVIAASMHGFANCQKFKSPVTLTLTLDGVKDKSTYTVRLGLAACPTMWL